MATNNCPECGEILPLESINVQEGVALCRECGQLSRLSRVAEHRRPIADVLAVKPSGCAIEDGIDRIKLKATLRSVPGAIGALAISLFWNGIVSVFLLIAVSGLYANLIGPVPNWFPAPQMDGKPMTLGMTLFLCAFLTPFLLIGSCMIGAFFIYLFGSVKVVITNDTGVVVTGVGPIAWPSRFDPRSVTHVSIGPTTPQNQEAASDCIIIEADRTVKFGSKLEQNRQEWLEAVLRVILVQSQQDNRRDLLSAAHSELEKRCVNF